MERVKSRRKEYRLNIGGKKGQSSPPKQGKGDKGSGEKGNEKVGLRWELARQDAQYGRVFERAAEK